MKVPVGILALLVGKCLVVSRDVVTNCDTRYAGRPPPLLSVIDTGNKGLPVERSWVGMRATPVS